MILFEVLLSFLGQACVRTPFLNQKDDVSGFLVDIREARSLADRFLRTPHSVNKTIIAASRLSEHETLPKVGVCLYSEFYQIWISEHDLQAERDGPVVVCHHIMYSSRELPRLKQLLTHTYSVRTSLRSTDTDDIIASFAIFFLCPFPSFQQCSLSM